MDRKEVTSLATAPDNTSPGPLIAVIGMAGRFPGARNLTEFWRNLRDGVESISTLGDEQLIAAGVTAAEFGNSDYVRAAAILDDIDRFDASFFGLSPRDAAIMDPQHRHFLECAWEALENAGWSPDEFRGRVGVYAGSGMNSYLFHNLLANPELVASAGLFLLKQTGNDKDVLASRVSYQLNLTGPSLAVQTACSTSLVAIHLACQSLLNHECDMALAGGVTIEIPHGRGYLYRESEILSRDGHCRSFDAASSGTIFGSGVGIVVLRRLEDAISDGDLIHAVIRGTAINNDGARKVGYLAPSVAGQAEAIAEALTVSDTEADSISYIETHGTGTAVGDPIEIAALTRAFRTDTERNGFCAIGSLKTNIGHLDAAAGVAGFIKTVLALEHQQLPPILNFSEPNPLIDFDHTPFYVNSKLRDWRSDGQPRRAGVTSLGIGGTNAHAILEEAPPAALSGPSRPWQLLTLSAKTPAALDAMAQNLADYLEEKSPNLADVAFTGHLGRKAFRLRRAVVCREAADASDALRRRDVLRIISNSARDCERPIMFLFPGGGTQYVEMGRQLYESEREFRSVVDFCAEFLKPILELDLRNVLFPADDIAEEAARLLDQIQLIQPALFVIEYALARLWIAWGIKPNAMVGHSLGEFTAACIAGVFPLETALRIVAERGRLMKSVAPGAMTAVTLPEAEIVRLLHGKLEVAAVNAEDQCVVAGPEKEMSELEARLSAVDVNHRRLRLWHTSHCAMMEPILKPFAEFLAKFEFQPPRIPYVSSVTGKWISDSEATDPRYWARHLRQTVRFAEGLCELLSDPDTLLIEIGPGSTLCALTAQHSRFKQTHGVIPSMRSRRDETSDVEFLLHALGQLWAAGCGVDWRRFHAHESRRRVQLPSYPFERQRFWIDPGKPLHSVESFHDGCGTNPEQRGMFFRPVWQQADLPRSQESGSTGGWLIFRDSEGLGAGISELLRRRGERYVEVLPGASLSRITDNTYRIDPRNPRDYSALIAELAASEKMPRTIVHLWSVEGGDSPVTTLDNLTTAETMSFFSLLFLSQALATTDFRDEIRLGVVANGLWSVSGEPVSGPERALLLGPCGTIPKEFPNIRCSSIDIDLPRAHLSVDGRFTEALSDGAAQIVSELYARSIEPIVAYRKNRRWIRTFAPLPIAEDGQPASLKDGGVYLISGGLGGIGLVLAELLARRVQARLVLVSREGLPMRQEWDAWLAGHDPTEPIVRKIQKVRAIEAAGGELMIVKANVTDLAEMRQVVADTRARFGPIDGVIHAAGVLSEAAILEKDQESVSRVLAPKLRGTYVLESVCANEPLDFFVLMSSISSRIAPAGQVDYSAANAFLDSFAQSRAQQGKPVIAIDWPRWRDVGMVANRKMSAEGAVVHPLLGRVLRESEFEAEYLTALRLESDWIVGEHRIKGGPGLFPGAGYIEMVRAAVARLGYDGPLKIRDLEFTAPLRVWSDSEQSVRFRLVRERRKFRFFVSTRAADREDWTGCAFGEAECAVSDSPVPRHIEELRNRCNVRRLRFDRSKQNQKQQKYISFGPRWRSLQRVYVGRGEGLNRLELPVEFNGDLANYHFHPALLDVATGAAMFLIDGYALTDRLYIPISYGSISLFRHLPAKCYSHVRSKSGTTAEAPIATFDITIFDENGNVIAEISDFALRAVAGPSGLDRHSSRSNPQKGLYELEVGAVDVAESTMPAATDSIDSHQGVRAFEQILADPRNSNVIVYPSDFAELVKKSCAVNAADRGPGRADARREDDSSKDEVEAMLARWFEELLGVEKISRDDDFFELGGQSLTGVRLMAKLNKTFGVSLKLATLFEAPTIETLAQVVRRKETPTVFSSVVPIRPHGSLLPLFVIHGIGGKVLGFHGLISQLQPDQPIYGIEYSIGQSTPPLLRIEELAAHYIKEIRKVQSQGPYSLLGYSFGGVLAFEIAQQLYAMGQTIGLLGMIDTSQRFGAHGEGAPGDLFRTANRKVRALRLHARRVLWGPDRLPYIRDQLSMRMNDLAVRTRAVIYAALTSVGHPIPTFFERAYDVNWFAWRRYRPRPYPGVVTLFRATAAEGGIDERYGYELGWKPLTGAGVDVHEIPGTHLDLMREPNVRFLAREVIECLARARDRQLRDSILMTPKQRADGEASSHNAISAADERVHSRSEPMHARSV